VSGFSYFDVRCWAFNKLLGIHLLVTNDYPMSKRSETFLFAVIVAVMCFVSSRGFFTMKPRAGHDSAAYPVTQHQFHINILDGNLFPRWAPDMRYGYGHPKLQFRPPILHYIAEPFYMVSGDPFFCLNAAVVILTLVAGMGMFMYMRLMTRPAWACVAAGVYITFNYLLANMYNRGAYYEVAAYAFVPWILWSQYCIAIGTGQSSRKSFILPAVVGTAAWAGMICGHPATAFFFTPIAVLHVLLLWYETRSVRNLLCAYTVMVAGILVSSPYSFVFLRETSIVRMQIFLTGFDAYHRNFISFARFITDSWPDNYLHMRELIFTPYLWPMNWVICYEILSFNLWTLAAIVCAPILWFVRGADKRLSRLSMFFFLSLVALAACAAPVSKVLWDRVQFFHAFNFPWRAIGVMGVCCAALAGITLENTWRRWVHNNVIAGFAAAGLMIIMAVFAWPRSSGWPSPWGMEIKDVTSEEIRPDTGISSQFYTPKWVRRYAERPAEREVFTVAGDAEAMLVERRATCWKIRSRASRTSRVAVAHYYYPGWQAYARDGDNLSTEAWSDRGLSSFVVPPGEQDIELRFGATSTRVIGSVMFFCGIGIAFLCPLMLVGKEQRREFEI